MIELILLNISHDSEDLERNLKSLLGRPHSAKDGAVYRVRCHNLAEAEELQHRLPQVLGPGAAYAIADWENASLIGDEDARVAFVESLHIPVPVTSEPAEPHLQPSDPA